VNTEEFFRQVRLDELADREDLFGRMKPIDYARSRGITPQLVYYRIRLKGLEYKPCPCCGTPTIDTKEADVAIGLRVPTEATSEEEEESRE
jgi:hypothetical protein